MRKEEEWKGKKTKKKKGPVQSIPELCTGSNFSAKQGSIEYCILGGLGFVVPSCTLYSITVIVLPLLSSLEPPVP